MPTARRRFARLSALIFVLSFFCLKNQALENPSPQPSPSRSTYSVHGADFDAELSSSKIADGSMVVATLHLKKPLSGKIEGSFEEQSSPFFAVPELGPLVYEAFFAVVHSHKPGPALIKVSGDGIHAELPFEIVDGNYPSETLKVDNSRVNPPKKVMARIIREIAEIKKIYAIFTPTRYWSGPFRLPIDSRVTSPFGTKRVYNGQLKSYHGGLDLKAPEGTPIHAAGAGKVVLAKNLYYSGNTIILDHGLGLLSMYFHMSQFNVKPGDEVSQGQLLGLSGKTGRVTGPHLHWQVIVHETKVNPTGLLEVGK